MTSYLLTALLSCAGWVCFFVLNRTKVRRTGSTPRLRPNTLFVSNHQSTIDTLLIGLVTCHPRCWLEPRLLPWSLAAAEVYFRTPITSWFASRLRCLPLRRDRPDPLALRRTIKVLREGVVIHFPEGRRSESGALREASPGIGWLALASGAQVIPVAIDGMNEAVRFERFGLRWFRRIAVAVGPPVDLPASRDRAPSRAAARAATDVIMAAIEHQLSIARGMRRSQRRSRP